ncbi:ATP-grasp domain-containing protein [Psychrobacter sp. 1Y11]|uniref:ATP-grasp domain-containing protein n=1 Tax=Psychrobacter sp. 1Y11 TaxID=3457446 RepID=UPI003FD0302C
MTIYLLTMPDGTFGSAGQSWKRLDLNRLKLNLDFEVKVDTIDNINNLTFKNNDILIYTSSENEVIRVFLKNTLFYVKDKARLIPSYDLLMAHEDKGFQEILRLKENFGNLKGNYIFDIDKSSLDSPKVLKTSQGAGSSGVFLVKNLKELAKIKSDFFTNDLKRQLVKLQRKIKLNSSDYQIYKYRYKKFSLFVEQEFIPNLKHDFKVLVFGDRYFVLKRSIRKDDFRASGSGNFEFVEPPQEVLDFAKEIALVLDNPYLSLDIAQSDTGCHLIEFQGTNFGPYTLLNAPYRYVFQDDNWVEESNCKDLEVNYAYALNYYIKDKLNLEKVKG